MLLAKYRGMPLALAFTAHPTSRGFPVQKSVKRSDELCE